MVQVEGLPHGRRVHELQVGKRVDPVKATLGVHQTNLHQITTLGGGRGEAGNMGGGGERNGMYRRKGKRRTFKFKYILTSVVAISIKK